MKERITAKAIRNAFKHVVELGYCELYDTLHVLEPSFYTCGIYGWNADVYVIDSETAIVTGYRPFGKRPNRDILERFKEAEKNVNETDYDKRHDALYENLKAFVAAVK